MTHGDDVPEPFVLPRIPASSGALIFDKRGRLLIANPTYKAHWTIPGGIMESDGETPWEACQREVREEVGLNVVDGRLVAVDFLRPKPSKPGTGAPVPPPREPKRSTNNMATCAKTQVAIAK